MHCIVTAGPTFEPLDQVRRLTNFSTGRLGSELVNYLSGCGHKVTLLIGQQSTWRGERQAHTVETFTTASDLLGRLRRHASEEIGAVFHAAAVADFQVARVYRGSPGKWRQLHSGKIPTSSGPLWAELLPTPKIIESLRALFPAARLVGWKYEVDGDQARVVKLAREQLQRCRTNACVPNGPGYGPGFGVVTLTEGRHYPDMKTLFAALVVLVESGSC